MFVLYPTAAGTSAAAASHASDGAQNEHLDNDAEEEAPPSQRRRVGTSHRDMPLLLAADDSPEGEVGVDEGTSRRDMSLAADDSPEGEGGVDEGTSRRGMPLALADYNLQEGGGVEDVDDGEDEWMGSAGEQLMEEVENVVDEFHEEEGLGTAVAWKSRKR
jgi:hypothetical protein